MKGMRRLTPMIACTLVLFLVVACAGPAPTATPAPPTAPPATPALTETPVALAPTQVPQTTSQGWATLAPTPTRPATVVVVFEIGKHDGSETELQSFGFAGIHEYGCTAGEDCLPEYFPSHSYRMSAADIWDDSGVARITIVFVLKRGSSNVVLRLARWGAETSVVTVDGKREYVVTNTMLGSDERVHGVYDLSLGALEEGRHTILLTVAEDEKANGRHTWDAIMLTAKL